MIMEANFYSSKRVRSLKERGGHYAMGVRFLRRGLPVNGPGGAFWMGVHFRRDNSRPFPVLNIACR